MNDQEQDPALAGAVVFFQRHVVPVQIVFAKDGKEHPALFTAIVVSIRGRWLLMTAGHCLKDVQQMLDAGWRLKRCRLHDAHGPDGKHREPLPFDYEAAQPDVPIEDDDKFDYGFLTLGTLVCEALRRNGVVPIDEEAWLKECSEPEFFVMTGLVGSRSHVEGRKFSISMTMLYVRQLDVRPHAFDETEAPRWYGEVLVSPDGPASLEGMSGGPVFALRCTDAGLKYWLHGIQSAQAKRFPDEPFIAVSLARPMLAAKLSIMDR